MDTPISEAEVLRQINSAKQSVQEHKNTIHEHVYAAMDGLSRTALAYINTNKNKDKQEQQSWAIKATDDEGKPIWNSEQAILVESSLPSSLQQGGFSPSDIRLSAQSTLFSSKIPTDISMDSAVSYVSNYLASIDEKNREIARTIGPVAFINNMKEDPGIGPFLPYLPFRIFIPANAILPVINAILEACRLLVTTNRFDNPNLRKILSLVIGILDISRGEWRDGVLSLLGLISRDALLVGVVGKTTRFIYNWISPDIQARLESDFYAASKSMFIGGWLWLLSIVSPRYVRDSLNKLFESTRESYELIKQKAIENGDKLGLQVTFPKSPIDSFLTFNDIQNLQSILHQPEIVCNPIFQQQLQSFEEIPGIRLILELLNIPTTPEDKQKLCSGQPEEQTLVESITDGLKPIVVPKVGGKHRKFKRKGLAFI
uniref:Uncharacterized protein n=1 Tax=viral metagenome TaxID=1070528 RepID=A0A6C0HEJ1_9ZZZZ